MDWKIKKKGFKVKDICKITGYSMGAVARGIKDSNLEEKIAKAVSDHLKK